MVLQCLEHTFNAFLLVINIGVHIKIQGRAYTGMPQQDTHGLIVAAALDRISAATSSNVLVVIVLHDLEQHYIRNESYC
jgi:hypothetical protein